MHQDFALCSLYNYELLRIYFLPENFPFFNSKIFQLKFLSLWKKKVSQADGDIRALASESKAPKNKRERKRNIVIEDFIIFRILQNATHIS